MNKSDRGISKVLSLTEITWFVLTFAYDSLLGIGRYAWLI